MKYFPVIADTIFYAVCAFLLGFCVLRFWGVSAPLAALDCALLALAVGTGVFFLERHSRRKKYLSAKQRAECDALLMHLSLSPPEKKAELLASALSKEGRKTEREGSSLCVDGKAAELLFCMEPASADELARAIGRRGGDFILYCNRLSDTAESLLKRFPVEAVRGEEVYDLLRRTDSIPKELLGSVGAKTSHREKLRAVFQKSSARPFFLSGAMLLIMSLFTLFPVYYLATGSVLLLLSVVLRLLAPA
mgnify:FL=1